MTYFASTHVEFFGEEFAAHIEYDFTEGYPAGWYDPGCGDEVDVHNIWFQRVDGGPDAPWFKLTGKAFRAVCWQDWVDATCIADQRGAF